MPSFLGWMFIRMVARSTLWLSVFWSVYQECSLPDLPNTNAFLCMFRFQRLTVHEALEGLCPRSEGMYSYSWKFMPTISYTLLSRLDKREGSFLFGRRFLCLGLAAIAHVSLNPFASPVPSDAAFCFPLNLDISSLLFNSLCPWPYSTWLSH